jgi:three-Cys-motif partner protein
MARDRTWGYWTEQKLQMLADYLPAFTRASKAAGGTIYFDLFAGDTTNISRTSGRPIEGSPRVALNTMPVLDKIVLFELPAQAARLRQELAADFPDRDASVVTGDCNVTMQPTLRSLAQHAWKPSFALVDQYAAEVHRSTLEALSTFRTSKRGFPTELWLLFAPSMLRRGLASDSDEAVEDFTARVDALFGTTAWRAIHGARLAEVLTADQHRDESVNLMRWRLENVLGYQRTHSFNMFNVSGVPLYTMIFATSNLTGDKIMADIYAKAARLRPQMQAEAAAKQRQAREQQAGMLELFDDDLVVKARHGSPYLHIPPTTPWCGSRSTKS